VSLNKFKKTEITHLYIISGHTGIKLELNKRNYRKYSDIWRLNNTLLNDQWVTEEIRGKTKQFLKSNENEKCNLPEPVRHSKGHAKGKVYS
jgi:hypothetical protein